MAPDLIMAYQSLIVCVEIIAVVAIIAFLLGDALATARARKNRYQIARVARQIIAETRAWQKEQNAGLP